MSERKASLVRSVLAGLGYWAPVWVALALLAQVGMFGLRPALVERERLQLEEAEVLERHDRARANLIDLETEVAAWEDPIYRERLRRLER